MLDPATTTVIANPAAAGGMVGAKWATFEEQIRQYLGPVTMLRTANQGHGIILARHKGFIETTAPFFFLF